jgi:adenosylcobinamide amidohydrolase
VSEVASELTTFPEVEAPALACLAWRLREPMRVLSTAPVGGGLGVRDWVLNVQVPNGYARRDIDSHVAEVARSLRLAGLGVGMLTAAEVARVAVCDDEPEVRVEATVGLSSPEWAAAPEGADPAQAQAEAGLPGTINIVAFVPVRHSDAALANLLCTVTEAKAQALLDDGIPGTGTATDAVTVLCPRSGPVEPFGGPRSTWGARVARAVYAALRAGMETPA